MSIRLIFSGRTHKQNETISDCQDYYQSNVEKDSFAIADGASQSFYPSLWAEFLVNHFCENPDINQGNWQQWLEVIQEKWLSEVKYKVEQAKNEGHSSWITNSNRLNVYQHSATSTFIGLRFLENEVKVSIVGDSCLFIIKNNPSKNTNRLLGTYLLKESKDFGNRPEYFASYNKNNDFEPYLFNVPLKNKQNSEKLYFILTTDALSEYVFNCLENKEKIIGKLLNIDSQEQFESFVESARNSKTIKMKNDDVTLMILELSNFTIDPSDLPSIFYQNRDIKNSSEIQISGVDNKSTDGKNNQDKELYSSEVDENDSRNEEKTRKTDKKKINNGVLNNVKLLFKKNNSTVVNKSQSSHSVNPKIVERNLKNQRFLLACLASLLFIFIIADKVVNKKTSNQPITTNPLPTTNNINHPPTYKFIPEFIEVEKQTSIYKDQQLKEENLILSLSNPARVLIIEQGDNWIKFHIDLYAYESLLEQCNDCQEDEIKIKPNTNIRMWTDSNDNSVFGQLKEGSNFKKVEFNYFPKWYKFEFEGYIKKDEISSKN